MLNRHASRLLGLLLILITATALAAPKKDLWARWDVFNPMSTSVVDNHLWAAFLKKYVVTNHQGVNVVRYSAVTPQDNALLLSYLKSMQAVDIDNYNRDEQLAFWINLYNAQTVYTVLKHYPVKSILEINTSPGVFSKGPWGHKTLSVLGEKISLNDIEHRILRPIWNDYRIHFAVNCASMGCPNLQKKPFEGKDIDVMLDKAATEYINSARGVVVRQGKLKVSRLFIWYEEDFGNTQSNLLKVLDIFAAPALKAQLQRIKRISGSQYDWALNGS